MRTTPEHARVASWLRTRAFPATPAAIPRVGAEIEWIGVDAVTGHHASVRRRLYPLIAELAARQHWTEASSAKGVPRFLLPGGGCITFEPGGQIEYAAPPYPRVGDLLDDLSTVTATLRSAAAARSIALLDTGIDPVNPLERVPLELNADRYLGMDAYFAPRGDAGARMMRQTAAVQVSLDAAHDPYTTWRVTNAAAPYLVAMFANSRVYAGRVTDFASYRAQTWRELDPTRTGLHACTRDAVAEYTDFALAAPVMFMHTPAGTWLSLAEWLRWGGIADDALEAHLSTLFPEVRPRGFFEVRSVDALPDHWRAAPIVLLAGLVMDERALLDAADLLGAPEPALLETAGGEGLEDPRIARVAAALSDIAVRGVRRLGDRFCHPEELARIDDLFDRFTRRGYSPGHEILTARRKTG